ncbi:MAG: alcohol dehydrogenase catalytic domain-containing protein [Rhodococcus sp. (in: high G+C Gram-positive bacteria)]|nr:alcohol dehydrogenase catalytic domain-containing protein [Rhodococcus sp. (in: high G+C Gram-positive bacteria)]
MRAIGVTQPGDEDELQVLDLPVKDPQNGEVRIRVHAATVNPTDTAMIRGAYYRGDVPPGPHIPGMDLAGVVDAIGAGVDRFAVGDRVVARQPHPATRGAYQEQIGSRPAGSCARRRGHAAASRLERTLVGPHEAVPTGGTVAGRRGGRRRLRDSARQGRWSACGGRRQGR